MEGRPLTFSPRLTPFHARAVRIAAKRRSPTRPGSRQPLTLWSVFWFCCFVQLVSLRRVASPVLPLFRVAM